jgi:DtxR family Mn-dependent transcriptional regulator
VALATLKRFVGSIPKMPSSTVEDYLKAILKLQRADDARVSPGAVSQALGVSPGTVTSMMKTLADSGLVSYEPYSGVLLTPEGRSLAIHVIRRHRLVELFLVQVLGMDWSEVHAEAERLEHVVSDAVIGRIDDLLGHPSVDPHGDPIPDRHGMVEELDHPSLATCEVGRELRVVRVLDQDPEFLRSMEDRGLTPGRAVRVEERARTADTVALVVDGGSFSLGLRAAAKVFVEAAE